MYFRIYKDKAGEYRFALHSGNHQVVAQSEGYKAKQSALDTIASIQRGAATAEIKDESEN